jgi:hypothetical protein
VQAYPQAGGGVWSGSASASLDVPNPTCDCISGNTNFAFLYGASMAFYPDALMDPQQAGRVQQWLDTAYPWWNDKLAWAGSSKRLGTGNRYTVYVTDLSYLGNVAMRFTNDGPAGEIRIEVDPMAFDYSDDMATTWMAHELGHALGIAGHSACDQNSSLMAVVVNVPQYGVDKDAESCWMFSEYGNFNAVCHHS